MITVTRETVAALDAFMWHAFIHLLRQRGAREDEIRCVTLGAKSHAEFRQRWEQA